VIDLLKIPTHEQASQLMDEAENRNPGPWVQHSVFAAQAAERIAAQVPELDTSTAFVLGYLYDIGRREGVTDMRHILDGYNYLTSLGFTDAARICLTHSFPLKNIAAAAGKWDCSQEEYEFIKSFLASIEFTAYDRLIQLCDALASPTGFCLIEKRVVDVAIRRGVNELAVEKWTAYLAIQKEFEQIIGESVYHLLPGVVENTFGFDPHSIQAN
jgi:hypothetical protein